MASRGVSGRRATTRPKYRVRVSWGRFWGVVAAVAAAVAAVACYPRVSVAATRTALATVRTDSIGTGVTNVRIHWSGGAVRATVQRGALRPVGLVPAGQSVVVTAHVAGPPWLAWLPAYRASAVWTIETPAAPVATHTTVLRSLAHSTPVPFSKPVAKWRVDAGNGFGPWRRGPVQVAPGAGPGERGQVEIEAVSRAWEQTDHPVSLRWQTPSYLTASLTSATILSPGAPIVMQFSQPLADPNPTTWQVSPPVQGTWQSTGSTAFRFTPSGAGFPPDATVTVTVPGGPNGVRGANHAYLAKTFRATRTVAAGSVTRLQQWLAALGYLPVVWKPTGSTAVASPSSRIWQPQAGTFAWRWATLPSALTALWQPGAWTVMTQGALMQFQRVAGLAVTGVADGTTWTALRSAWLHKRTSPDGYTYILASETLPEHVQLWVNGVETLTTLANTGIPATPTYLGTYPIYERLPFQIMRGVNPNGTHYADPVHWINYFRGGDAVHGFVRAQYGFPQSLGCVELPLSVAPIVYHTVHYGTLVTVLAPGTPA